MRMIRVAACALAVLALVGEVHAHAQAALLMEEPYGFFGTVNPTGHNAIYLEHVCAETPVKLRRCHPGEMGAVIARYDGVNGYDWIAMPLIPYLYAVENASQVPDHVDHDMVEEMRDRYRERHLDSLGEHLRPGNLVRGGWKELVGAAYERKIYVFRFATTPEQDDALIALMNDEPNHSHFSLLFNNCADFARVVLNNYFPHTFRRSIFPDAGVTTPKQITYKLVRYARKHPETQLKVFVIPQIPGYRRNSRSNKNIAESFVTTAYAVPIALVNPYLAGGILVDYLVRGRYHLIPKHPEVLSPDNLMTALTAPPESEDNPRSASAGTPGPDSVGVAAPAASESHSGLKGIETFHV